MTFQFRKLAPWLVVAILSAGLAACGSDDDDSDSGAAGASTGSTATGATAGNSSSGAGAWEGEFETGTDVALTLWVDASDPELAPFEAFRVAAGANPVRYGKVVATNDGSAPDTSRFAMLTGDDGDTFSEDAIELNFLCSLAGRWIAVVATQTTELINQYNLLLTDQCNGNTLAGPPIAPGQTVTYYVAYEGDSEPEFKRIFMGLGNELKR